MRIQSQLTPREYISAMMEQMQGHFDFGQERFTGFFLGRFFSVTYHTGYEWNRRISNQKDTAIGYVHKTESGCEVRCVCLRALMAPTQFLPIYISLLLLLLAAMFLNGIWNLSAFLLAALVGLGVLLIAAPISAVITSCTEDGETARKTIISFLLNPSDPYANYSKIR